MQSLQAQAALALALLGCTLVQGACPHGWQLFGNSCYDFVNKERAWPLAEVFCVRHGAHLAKVESNDENEYLRGYLTNNSRTFSGYDMWLGGEKKVIGAGFVWQWADGSGLEDGNFTDWQAGWNDGPEPEQCLELDAGYSLHWNDDYCDELNYFICERPSNPMTPPTPIG